MFSRRADQKTTSPEPDAGTAGGPALRLATLPPAAPPIGMAHAAPPPLPVTAQLSSVEQSAHSVIGEDLTIEGQAITIRCRGALEINGRIQAELHSQKLMVGRSGQVEGTIAADHVEVWGRVNGTIKGARVSLHPGSEVEGDILSKSLAVADGASFEGRSRKVTDLEQIAPQFESLKPAASQSDPVSVPVPMARI